MTGWTLTDKNLIRTMWAKGAQSSEIVPCLSVPKTRNAVMGMLNRLGLMGLGNPSPERLETIDRVSDLMQEEFSLGSRLHCEALLTLMTMKIGKRDAKALSVASGVSLDMCSSFLERLPLVWSPGEEAPVNWAGGIEGNIAFILDMAVIAGSLDASPVRPSGAVIGNSKSLRHISRSDGDPVERHHSFDKHLPFVGSRPSMGA